MFLMISHFFIYIASKNIREQYTRKYVFYNLLYLSVGGGYFPDSFSETSDFPIDIIGSSSTRFHKKGILDTINCYPGEIKACVIASRKTLGISTSEIDTILLSTSRIEDNLSEIIDTLSNVL